MRRITISIAATSVAAVAAGLTAALAGGPTTAAPRAADSIAVPVPVAGGSCGFRGTGQAPDCHYRVTSGSVRVELRNTAPIPVRCTLAPYDARASKTATDLGPLQRGVLSWPASGDLPRVFEIDCRSVIPVAGKIAQRAIITVSGSANRTTSTPTPRRATPRAVTPRTTSPRTTTPTRPAPTTRTTPTVSPTTTDTSPTSSTSTPAPTTTTTTTPVG